MDKTAAMAIFKAAEAYTCKATRFATAESSYFTAKSVTLNRVTLHGYVIYPPTEIAVCVSRATESAAKSALEEYADDR